MATVIHEVGHHVFPEAVMSIVHGPGIASRLYGATKGDEAHGARIEGSSRSYTSSATSDEVNAHSVLFGSANLHEVHVTFNSYQSSGSC